jgi:hypothetical protein
MKFPNLRFMTIFVALAAALALGPLATAAVITGTGQVTGTANVTNSTIQFFDNSSTPNTLSTTSINNTGSYSSMNSIPSTSPAVDIGELTGGPFSGTLPSPGIPDYATFLTTPTNIDFDLTAIPAGTGNPNSCFSNTVGNVCTPYVDVSAGANQYKWFTTGACPAGDTCVLSPFTLIQQSGEVFIDLDLQGLAYTPPPGPPAPAGSSSTIGALSTQLTVTGINTITGIDAQLHGSTALGSCPAGTVCASASGNFTSTPASTVPEPTTAFLGLSGLLIAAGLYRRRSHQS